jgi:hypothetical protein
MCTENHGGIISMGKLIHPPELSGNPTSSHLVAKQEELAKEIMNLALQSIFNDTLKGPLTCRKMTWDRWLYFPSEGSTVDFYCP